MLNERAVEFAVRLGVALHCSAERSVFARKNYFYPDMPKDYQISQYDLPINVDGWLDLPSGKRVGIERAHIEEDTGKSTHVGGGGRIHEAGYSLVDYNRSGVPLVEIVGRPDLRSAEEARQYVAELRAVLVAIGVSDARMEEGSMRVDANVSVRPVGADALGTRCEIKNLNSLRSLGRAIDYEARRQVDLLEAGGRVAAGDPALGRGRRPHAHAALQGGGRRLPVLPRARPGAGRAGGGVGRVDRRACRCCRPTGGRGWPWPPGSSRRPARWPIAVARDLDGLALAAIEAGADAAAGADPRRAQPRGRRRGRADGPPRSPALVALETRDG